MDFVLKFNRVWAFLLVIIFGLSALYGSRLPLFVAAIVYLAASFLAVRQNRVAVILVFIFSGIVMLRFLPMVLYNLAMFVFDPPLYQDSPATILVVLVTAMVFAIPATVVSAFFVRYYKDMVSIVCAKPFRSLERSGHLIAKSVFYILLAGAAVIFCVSFYLLHQNSPTWDSERYWQEQKREKSDYDELMNEMD